MTAFIDYFNFIITKIVEILDSLKLPDSYSLLYYLLGAIIIGLIFQLIKGGSTEFEQNTNFLNSRIISSGVNKYNMKHNERKQQIVNNISPGKVSNVEEAKFAANLKFKRMNVNKNYSYSKSPYKVGIFESNIGGVDDDWFD